MARAKKEEAQWHEVREPVCDNGVLYSAYGPTNYEDEFCNVVAQKGAVTFGFRLSREEVLREYPGRDGTDLDRDFTPVQARAFANALLFAADVAESGVRPTA